MKASETAHMLWNMLSDCDRTAAELMKARCDKPGSLDHAAITALRDHIRASRRLALNLESAYAAEGGE